MRYSITKFLRPFTGTGAIFFPVGHPPFGTCENATPDCYHYCYAVDKEDLNFDEELRISKVEKRAIYNYFVTTNNKKLKSRIIRELDGLQTPILHWFGTGDCLNKDLPKISKLIDVLRGENVIQMGFTRNKKLWELHKDVFALSIDSKKEATDPNAMYSIPDYKKQISVMYCPSYQVVGGYCGALTCRDKDKSRTNLEHYINCRTCLRMKTGCFDRRNNV